MDILLFNQIIIYLINIVGIWIAFWVWFANRVAKVNKMFFLMTIFILLWIDSSYLSSLSNQIHLALFWVKVVFGAVSMFLVSAYFFVVYFPREEKRYPILDKVALGIGVILGFISILTDLIVKNVEFKEWGVDLVFGVAWNSFYIIVAFFAFLVLGLLFKKYFKLPFQEKLKIQYFLVGFLIFSLMNLVFNVVFPLWRGSIRYNQFGSYSAILLLIFTAYAILKRELFGIKVVLTSLLIGAIGIVLALQILIAPNTLWRIIDTIIFLLFCLFGYYLLRAVQQEEKRREEAEMLAIREMAFRQKAEKLAAEFKRLDEAKTQFMLATQHHLRTPLTSIQGYLSMLLEGSYGKISDRAKPKIKNALVATQRLIRLANEFLDVAQFEVGKETMAKREVQIEEVFDEVVDELRQTAKEKKLYVKLERPEQSLPSIMVDREKIKEAIYNVVFNGIKYTERGGVTVKLEIVNGKLQIVITDTGIGMEPEEIAGLFAKTFERGEQAKKLYTTGRGIGLYLAYQIIKAHGGRLWAESEGRGKGSTFYIELPIN